MQDDEQKNPPKQDGLEQEEKHRREWAQQDAEVAAITRTVRPGSDAPSRAGITPDGSGADGERG